MSQVAADTRAAVAAATHLVGSPALGGSWDLDCKVGSVTAALPFDPSAFQGVLSLSNVQLSTTSVQGGGNVLITWSGSPSSSTSVDVLLSTDGGNTFPTTLVSNLPDDNAFTWKVPANLSTTTAQVKVADHGSASNSATSATFSIAMPVVPIISTVAGNNTNGYSGDGSQAVNANLSYPYGVAADSQGNVYIADSSNSVVRRVDHTTGLISTVAGNGTQGSSGDNSQATAAELSYPYGVAFDSQGNLFIADEGASVIREVNASTGVTTERPATSTCSSPPPP